MKYHRAVAVLIVALAALVLTAGAAGASFPGRNGKIIFTSGVFEAANRLKVMGPNGSNVVRLPGRHNFSASWAPDGTKFVYSHTDVDTGRVDLFTRNANGSGPVRLTDTEASELFAGYSPNGAKIVFERCGRQCDLWKMNADGTGRVRLTNTRADEIAPTWSTRNQIAFERFGRRGDSEIFKINRNGGDLVRLTDNRVFDGSPSWAPDGMRLAFDRCGRTVDCEIFSMRANGSDVTQLTQNTRQDFQPAYSPNGRSIVFVRSRGESSGDIFRMHADGTGVGRLTHTPARFEVDPDWQPL